MAPLNGKQPPVLMHPTRTQEPASTATSKGYRAYTTVTGYVIQYRTLPPDFQPALRARIEAEHTASKPAVPTVSVPGPDGEMQVPIDVNGEIHDDGLKRRISEYKRALGLWESEISSALTREMQAVLLKTLKFEVDKQAVAEIRDIYSVTADDLSDEDDRYVMLWRVILTDQGDQTAVGMSLQGIGVEEAAERARAMFRRTLERAFDAGDFNA